MRNLAIPASVAALLLLSGCFSFTPRVNSVASSLENDLDGASFEKEFGLKFGRLSTSLARGIARWALDEGNEEDRAILATLRGVRRVEIATYETRGSLRMDTPLRIESKLERKGWRTIARVRENDGFTWVVYGEKEATLKGFMVIALDDYELTLVDLRGNLERTLAAAMRLAREGDQIASLRAEPARDRDSEEIGLAP